MNEMRLYIKDTNTINFNQILSQLKNTGMVPQNNFVPGTDRQTKLTGKFRNSLIKKF